MSYLLLFYNRLTCGLRIYQSIIGGSFCLIKSIAPILRETLFLEELPATKYTIPLSGYGGNSQIRVEGLDRSDRSGISLHNEYVPELYAMSSNGDANGELMMTCL